MNEKQSNDIGVMENTQSPMRPSNWNPHRRGLVPQYKYKTVKEIYSSNDSKEFHNVFGVVVDSRPVEKSKGSGLRNFNVLLFIKTNI